MTWISRYTYLSTIHGVLMDRLRDGALTREQRDEIPRIRRALELFFEARQQAKYPEWEAVIPKRYVDEMKQLATV